MKRRPPRPPAWHSAGNSLLPQAVALHQAGRLSEAAKLYEQILAQVPRQFDATHLLGVLALQEGRFEQARHLIAAALAINPNDSPALGNLGTAHLRSGQLDAAYVAFERAARLEPNSAACLTNLGTVLRRLNRPREALIPLRRAFTANPKSATVCNVLGTCLLDIGDTQAAVELFEVATRAEPDDSDGWVNLASALNSMGEHERALECADKAVAISPYSSAALAVVAAIQFEKGQIADAVETYRKAIALPGATTQVHSSFASALIEIGSCAEATDQLRLAIKIDGNNAVARWKLVMANCLPIYSNEDEIASSRHAFSQGLVDCDAWFRAVQPDEAYHAVGTLQPFYLAYQPFNNKDLLSRYGNLCAQWMASLPSGDTAAKYNRFETKRRPTVIPRKMRIGIASAHIRNHSVWDAVAKGWVHNLNKANFEIYLFQLSRLRDEETDRARRAVAHIEDQPTNLQGWIQAINQADVDALIYPEIGMDPLTTQLASLRLAPIQATAWGHPDTSGLPTMDMYLSADAFEPVNSQQNYRERLVLLPNLGVYVEPLVPASVAADLRSLRLPDDEPLLLCPGAPFKYSPLHDKVWARIAKGLNKRKGGRLVFFRSRRDSVDELLYQRMRKAFDQERVDFDSRVSTIPTLDRSRFYSLMQHSALMLDTLGFSGFNTALQAVECGLPVVAREGEFMRGRLASGIMRRVGLPELVATTDEDFIQIAIRLAADASRRKELRLELTNRCKILFHDVEPVRALEHCLAEAIVRSRNAPPTG